MKIPFKHTKPSETEKTSSNELFEALAEAGFKPERGVSYYDLRGLPSTLGHLAMSDEERETFLSELDPALERLGCK